MLCCSGERYRAIMALLFIHVYFLTVTRPRSHISARQKSVPHSGAVTVMNLKQTQVDILRSEIAMFGGMVRTISVEHFRNGLALVECFEKIW